MLSLFSNKRKMNSNNNTAAQLTQIILRISDMRITKKSTAIKKY